MTIDLTGKAALITGAGTGIGRATAIVPAGYGAKVVVAGRRLELEETARLVEKAGGEALAVRADVSVEDDVRSVVDQARACGDGRARLRRHREHQLPERRPA